MTTLLLVVIATSSILLTAGFILLYREPKKSDDKKEPKIEIKPYHYSTFSEVSGEDKEKAMEEAEKEYTVKTPVREDNEGIDIDLLKQQLLLAKNKDTESHLRLRAGEYLLKFKSMPFIDELIARLESDEQNAVYETFQMAKNTTNNERGEYKPWLLDLQQL